MKKTIILFASTVALIAAAQASGERLHKLIPITTEEFAPVPGMKNLPPEIHIIDIDSVTFDVDNQWFQVYANPINGAQTLTYDLSKMSGFKFSYLPDGVLPSPSMSGEIFGQNSAHVKWAKIDDAVGYQIACGIPTDYSHLGDIDYIAERRDTIVGAENQEVLLQHLNYSTTYSFFVRALSPKGEGFHSDWSHRARLTAPTWDYFNMSTDSRLIDPKVLSLKAREYDNLTLSINTYFDPNDYAPINPDSIRKIFRIVDNHFVVDKIVCKRISTGETKEFKIGEPELSAGEIKITDLEEGENYNFTAFNSNIPWACDAAYNTITVQTKAQPAEPIVITSSDIREILSEYLTSNQAENQVFYLEGGKTYTLSGTENLQFVKGFTLATRPEDLEAGKRATLQITPGSFGMLGGLDQKSQLFIEPIILNGIDFTVPASNNFGTGSATGNYFLNTYSSAPGFSLEAIKITDCTFQGFIRGFLRIQGGREISINHLNVDNNVFYNCGYYDNNGRGYSWFAGPGQHVNQNIFNDFSFTNNTIYDSPRETLIYNNGTNLDWPETTKWNIRIENNTFINFSTRSAGRYLINLRFVPGGSYFSVQRNLFVLAADENDARPLYNSGANIRQINGSGKFRFDIKDNYSVGCREEHLKDDGIFSASAFSATKNSFGQFTDANNGTAEDLIVKVGSTPLRATDLFTNPNPPYIGYDKNTPNPKDHAAPDNIFEALRYKQTPEVQNHEIYTLGIGDQRWKKLADDNQDKPSMAYQTWKELQTNSYSALTGQLYTTFDYLAAAECGTDLWQAPENGDMWSQLHNYENLTTEYNSTTKLWRLCYSMVANCNTVLKQANSLTDPNEDEMSILIAETKVLRAFYNFILVSNFGPVTLSEETNADADAETKPSEKRSDEKTFYDHIFNDLKEAITVLGTTPVDGDRGRVTKKAALGILARAYAQRAGLSKYGDSTTYWKLAAETAEDLIANAAAYDAHLYADIADMWADANNRKNREALFVAPGADANDEAYPTTVQFNKLFAYTCGGVDTDFFPSSKNPTKATSYFYGRMNSQSWMPSYYLMYCFNPEWDRRWEYSFTYAYGSFSMVQPGWMPYATGQITIGEKKIYPLADCDGIPSAHGSNQYPAKIWPKGETSGDVAKLLEIPSSSAEIGKDGFFGSTKAYAMPYPVANDDNRLNMVFVHESPSAEDLESRAYKTIVLRDLYNPDTKLPVSKLCPSFNKYNWSFNGVFTNNLQSKSGDMFIMRMAEIYLLAAEAEQMLGNAAKAADYLNVLRQRAARPGVEESSWKLNTVTEDDILDEYAREMCGEFNRWSLLKRHNAFESRLAKYNVRAAESFKSYMYNRPIPYEFLSSIPNKDEYGDNGYGLTPTSGLDNIPD